MEYKAYSFDLDDNLLKIPSFVYLEDENGNEVKFSTSEFEKIRQDIDKLKLKINKNSFREFKDDKKLMEDIKKSSEAGSWRNLIKCVSKHASIFAIITARGHSPLALREALKYKILEKISEEEMNNFRKQFIEKYPDSVYDKSNEEIFEIYLDKCKFYPVTHKSILKKYKCEDVSELKAKVFDEFYKYIHKYVRKYLGKKTQIKIGFSDDSPHHLNKMINSILEKYGLFFYQTIDDKKIRPKIQISKE